MTIEDTSPELLYFNGVNGATGEYGLPPMSGSEMSRFLQGTAPTDNLSELRWRHQQRQVRHFGVREGVDPKKLDQSGWGVVFANGANPAVRDALTPLLRLREEQAGDRFKICEDAEGYRRGDNKNKFLGRFKVGPGPVDPQKLPYYLLLVGSPEAIPYRLQSQLDVQYAVGRIHFETVQEYANYATSVVTAETKPLALPRKVSLFGVQNPLDRATQLSTRHLVKPLSKALVANCEDWRFETLLKDEATKAKLGRLLGGDDTPALLFTASHGMEFPNGDRRQLPHQGALLCQDWPGPAAWRKAIPQDFYFAGDDLADSAKLLGLIGFFFACYGAGTPELDEFSKVAFKDRREAIAPHPFQAALPSKMLSHPRGGALAVVGHVERAWGCSFSWPGAGAQTAVFESTLERLLGGYPVGAAMEYFDARYAELSTVLADELEEVDAGAEVDPYELSGMWTANNDARGYSIIGDPAVRLHVARQNETAKQRPSLTLAGLTAQSSPEETPPQGEDDALDDVESYGHPQAATDGQSEISTEPHVDKAEAAPLPETTEALTRFTVSTYATADPANPRGGRLQAQTHLSLTGDVRVYLHEDGVDQDTLAIHESTVREALTARIAYLKILCGQ